MTIRGIAAAVFAVSAGFLAAAQTVRGTSMHWVGLETREGFAPSVSFRADDLVGLRLSGSTEFLEGLVLEVVISDALRRYADSFALSVYRNVEEVSNTGAGVSVTAEVIYQEVLPYSTRVYLSIPVSPESGAPVAQVPGAAVLRRVAPEQFPISVQITPVMKGVPDSALERAFFLTAKPQVLQKGRVELNISKPAGAEEVRPQVLLNSQPIDPDSSPFLLDVGVHQLEVVSDAFKRETASFAVIAGQTSTVEIVLERSASFLTVDAPAGSEVYLDGTRVAVGDRVRLTEGTHAIRFKIGEISVSRKFDVRLGRNYSVSLLLDVLIKEE